MITITYNGSLNSVKEAVTAANQLLNNSQFYDDIRIHPSFDYTDVSPSIIADLIQNSNVAMRVIMYRARSRRVYGYDDYRNPDIIHINIRRNAWSNGSLVNTMIHETVHAVDNYNSQYGFGHGVNSSNNKGNSAPYWIGNLAEKIINGTNEEPVAMVHDDHPEESEEAGNLA
jgi:hypothetical protein